MNRSEKMDEILSEVQKIIPEASLESIRHYAEGNANDVYLIGGKYILKVAKENPKGKEVNDINTEGRVLRELSGNIEYVPIFVQQNPELGYYVCSFIHGEILKPHMAGLSAEEKEKLGKVLGSFLSHFHALVLKTELQRTPEKNYHMKRSDYAEILEDLTKNDQKIHTLFCEINEIISDSLSKNDGLVLTHSDYHWKNILIDSDTHALVGITDFGNVCMDHPEVDFRQMMGRYDIELGISMVLKYERLKAKKLDRTLLFAHCALNDLWHHYGRKGNDPKPWYEKWNKELKRFVEF